MELAIGKADFARALSSVAKAIESRNTIPILSHVLLTAEDGKLHIRGTDLDVEVMDAAPAGVVKPGSLCVDAKLLASIVTKAAGDISLTDKDGKVVLKSGKSRFTLGRLPAEDYPTMPNAEYSASFEADLAALFAPCVHAISTEETRYYLNGVFMHIQEDGDYLLRAVTTDGHRLTRHEVEYTGEDPFRGVIVPRKTVGLLPKGVLQVSVSESRIRVSQGSLTIVSKLIDGTFPAYDRVIPRDNDKLISFDGDGMKAAVGRVSVISSERGRAVKLAFASGGAVLTVNNPDSGTATDEIAVQYSGEPIEIGLNSQYLAEMLSQFPAGDVQLALADPGSPTIFTSDKAERLLGVLMPVRI